MPPAPEELPMVSSAAGEGGAQHGVGGATPTGWTNHSEAWQWKHRSAVREPAERANVGGV